MTTLARILCAIDLEKASERAFDRALSLAVISEAKLHLLHVTPANVPFSRRASERLRYLTELRERAEAAGVKVRVDEQHGDPARVIMLHANARKMDLVVLGSNRRRGWRRLREGSVSEARYAACGMASAHCSMGCSSDGRARKETLTSRDEGLASASIQVVASHKNRVTVEARYLLKRVKVGECIARDRAVWKMFAYPSFDELACGFRARTIAAAGADTSGH